MISNPPVDTFTPWSNYWSSKTSVEIPDRGSFNVYMTDVESTYVLICIHGAGHSALSFSLLAQALKSTCKVVAFDLKCHGDTPGDAATDLSIELLSSDSLAIVKALMPEGKKLLLLGHSLGGSIATRISHSLKPAGLFVIDTIEGIATAAMPRMRLLLTSRPIGFKSQRDAIRFIATSGEMANEKSAAVSAAGRVVVNEKGNYMWKTDLLPSEPFWNSWFKGFADLFIKAPTYKVLILPNIDHLDTPFTIGHMSGKFQLEIVQGTNHCIHEDRPEAVAEIVTKFIARMSEVPFWKKAEKKQ